MLALIASLTESVGRVFSNVASSCSFRAAAISTEPTDDVMNDAMSLGIHRLWKDRFVRLLDPGRGMRCLDVAGGTGDIAERLLDHARLRHADRDMRVHVVDINAEMLDEGRRRFRRSMYHGGPQVSFALGNAERLAEVEDNSIDLYTIAFGIRNCTHVDRVLTEAHRVLRPGGVFACLEFSRVTNPALAQLYRAYSFGVIPNLGASVQRAALIGRAHHRRRSRLVPGALHSPAVLTCSTSSSRSSASRISRRSPT